jgi:hypothetical protein
VFDVSDFRVDTGDVYADAMIERRLSQSFEFWALVDYLEEKGLLDRSDFLEHLSKSCAQYVSTVKIAHRSQDD